MCRERLEEILQDPRVKQAARKNLTGKDKEHLEQQPEASSNGASASHQNGSAQVTIAWHELHCTTGTLHAAVPLIVAVHIDAHSWAHDKRLWLCRAAMAN